MTEGPKLRVLVVEDEMLIAFEIEEALHALGFEVVGPVSSVNHAMEAAVRERLDGAILDVTVRDGKIFPVCDKLRERDIPFLIASGHDNWALPEALRELPRLVKPFTARELREGLRYLEDEIAARAQTRRQESGLGAPEASRDIR